MFCPEGHPEDVYAAVGVVGVVGRLPAANRHLGVTRTRHRSGQEFFFIQALNGLINLLRAMESRKKSSFLSGRATKRGGGLNGCATKQKKTFF